jgi:hypothetical protein
MADVGATEEVFIVSLACFVAALTLFLLAGRVPWLDRVMKFLAILTAVVVVAFFVLIIVFGPLFPPDADRWRR